MSWTITPRFTQWTPANITTALWLDANDSATITQSGGAITTWADKSGNNRTATANGNPTYSATGMSTSKPAVQLDGTDDRFVSSITGIGSLNALDVYMVTQTTTAAAADTNSAAFWSFGNGGAAGSGYPANSLTSFSSSTGALSAETVVFNFFNASFDNGRLGSSTYTRSANVAQLLQSTVSTTGSTLRSNGTAITLNLANQITTSTNTAPSNINYTIDSDFHIGALRSGGTLLISPAIKFGEFIVLPATADTLTRQKLEGYLAHKWGLTANLPADHPYKVNPPAP